MKIIAENMGKKKRFGKKLREKKRIFLKKEELRLYLVILFFLVSGVWYSHSAGEGSLCMGEAVALAKLEELEKPAVSARTLLDRININLANAEELMQLDGIGEKRAKDIIAYRRKNGKFQRIEDIMNVSGIEKKTFEKIKEYIATE